MNNPKPKSKLTLELIESRMDHIPTLPSVATELMKLSQDAHNFYDKVEELAKKDPSLALRIIKAANSAASASVSPITGINKALIRIGVIKTLSIITTVSVAKVFTSIEPDHQSIWTHSIQTALLCRYLARQLDSYKIDAEQAYLGGLLHDVGRFVFLQISTKIIDIVDSRKWNTSTELPNIENNLFGFTHADAGFIAAQKWKLPPLIGDAIKYHHHRNLSDIPDISVELKQLIDIIQLADSISTYMQRNPDWTQEQLQVHTQDKIPYPDKAKRDEFFQQLIGYLPVIEQEYNQVVSDLDFKPSTERLNSVI